MKSSYIDYLASTLLVALISGLSLVVFTLGLAELTGRALGPYSIVLDALLFLAQYGVISGVFVRSIRRLGQVEAASFDMSDVRFQWWKIVGIVHEFGQVALSPFSVLFMKPLIARAFGAKIGDDVVMGGKLIDPWFIKIEDRVILGLDSAVIAHEMISGRLRLKPVTIRRGATIGVHSVIMSGVTIGENSIVAPGSVVTSDTIIPANQIWAGTPARFKRHRTDLVDSPMIYGPASHQSIAQALAQLGAEIGREEISSQPETSVKPNPQSRV